MPSLSALCDFLDTFAPPELAADWDNIGLLVGDRAQPVERVITCLTLTPAVAAEAIRERANLIVTHHPLPFKPLKRLISTEPTGRLLLDLIRAGIAIHSPHTAFDSAAEGINQQLAEGLGLSDIQPIVPKAGQELQPGASEGGQDSNTPLGSGRYGKFSEPRTLSQVAAQLKTFLNITGLHMVGQPQRLVQRAAVACGSGGEFLTAAFQHGCELLITGETRLHTCYEAEAAGIAILLPGHYASERFGVERLAETLARQFAGISIWASRDEADPLQWV